MSPTETRSQEGDARRRPPLGVLVERFRALPAMDSTRLRADIDAVVDQSL